MGEKKLREISLKKNINIDGNYGRVVVQPRRIEREKKPERRVDNKKKGILDVKRERWRERKHSTGQLSDKLLSFFQKKAVVGGWCLVRDS